MSTFETLSIDFKVNAAQFKKDLEDVNKRVDDLKDGLSDTGEESKKTDSQFTDLAKSVGKVAAAYFGLSSVVDGLRTALGDVSQLDLFSRQTGVNIETIDAWSKAIKNAGGDAQAFQSTVLGLAQTFNSTEDVALQWLRQAAGPIQRMAEQVGISRTQRHYQPLGIDPTTVAILAEWGPAGAERALARQHEIGTVTEEDAEIAREFNQSIGELDDAFSKLNTVLLSKLLPTLSSFAEGLTDGISWFTKNFDRGRYEETGPVLDYSLFGRIYDELFGSPEPEGAFYPYPNSPAFSGAQGASSGIPDSYKHLSSFSQLPQIPTSIPSVSNSQSKSLYVGDISINTTSQDVKQIPEAIVNAIDEKSQFLNQLQQSNSHFDDGVVI